VLPVIHPELNLWLMSGSPIFVWRVDARREGRTRGEHRRCYSS
jgi:hypothetical protein